LLLLFSIDLPRVNSVRGNPPAEYTSQQFGFPATDSGIIRSTSLIFTVLFKPKKFYICIPKEGKAFFQSRRRGDVNPVKTKKLYL